jgi:thiamine phosphate synthase YjbQ (UPF0047 family)
VLSRIEPKDIKFAHDDKWHNGNGFSHVRASLIGPSLIIPFIEVHLALNTWQQIVFLEMDARPRECKVR